MVLYVNPTVLPHDSKPGSSQLLAKENFSLPLAGGRQCDQHADEQTDRSDSAQGESSFPEAHSEAFRDGALIAWGAEGAVSTLAPGFQASWMSRVLRRLGLFLYFRRS
jgi:hypothetical protein